jgi:hypothetical protein
MVTPTDMALGLKWPRRTPGRRHSHQGLSNSGNYFEQSRPEEFSVCLGRSLNYSHERVELNS